MIKRKSNGQFQKGSKPMAGFIKGERLGSEHPNWKGGMPKCSICKKVLTNRYSKNCHKHSFTADRIEKIKKGALKRTGPRHYCWKGGEASYRAIHAFIIRKYGKPEKCDGCGKTNLLGHDIHWSNIDHRYSRNIKKWKRLCSRCHGINDTKLRKKQNGTIHK